MAQPLRKRSKSENDLSQLLVLEDKSTDLVFNDKEKAAMFRNIINAMCHFDLLNDKELNKPDVKRKMFIKWTIMDFLRVTKVGLFFHSFITNKILNDETDNFLHIFELTKNTKLYSTVEAKKSIVMSLMKDFDARTKFDYKKSSDYLLSHPNHLNEMFANWTFLDLLHLYSFNTHFYPILANLIGNRCADFTNIAEAYSIRKAFKLFGKYMREIKISPYKLQYKRCEYPFEEVIRLITTYCTKEKLRKITFDCSITLHYDDDEDEGDHLYELEYDKTLQMLTKFMTSFEADSAKINKIRFNKSTFKNLKEIKNRLFDIAIDNNCHELLLTVIVEINEIENFFNPEFVDIETQSLDTSNRLVSFNLHCLIEIFKKLDFIDLLHLTELSSVFHDIIVNYVIGKKLLKFSDIKNCYSTRKAFQLFGKAMTKLDISQRDMQYIKHPSSLDEILALITDNCTIGKLVEITLRNFDAECMMSATINNAIDYFKNVKLLRIQFSPVHQLYLDFGYSVHLFDSAYYKLLSKSSDAVMEILNAKGKLVQRTSIDPTSDFADDEFRYEYESNESSDSDDDMFEEDEGDSTDDSNNE